MNNSESSTSQAPADIYSLIKTAQQSENKLLTEAFAHEDGFRKRSYEELLFMHNQIHQAFLQYSKEIDIDTLSKKILNRMEKDAKIMVEFNKEIKNYKPGETVSWLVASNKTIEIIEGASLLIKSDLKNIVYNQPIAGHDFKYVPGATPVLDDEKNFFYGTSKSTFLKGACAYTLMELTHKKIDELPNSSGKKIEWYADLDSASAYWCRLPEGFDASKFQELSFLVKKESEYRLVIIYSGYGFGGPRSLIPQKSEDSGDYGDSKESIHKLQDCSSWIVELARMTLINFSTKDFLRLWRLAFESTKHLVPSEWSSKEGKELAKHFEVVKDGSCPVGSIIVTRVFRQPDMKTVIEKKDEGYAGHMGISIGSLLTKEGTLCRYMLCANRLMPGKEGYGTEKVNTSKEGETVEIMSFQLKINL